MRKRKKTVYLLADKPRRCESASSGRDFHQHRAHDTSTHHEIRVNKRLKKDRRECIGDYVGWNAYLDTVIIEAGSDNVHRI